MYTAILLAAGQSSRMGHPKGLLAWEGKPLILHQIEQIHRSRIDRLIIVLGYRPELYQTLFHFEDQRMTVIWNEKWEEGKSSSILAGLSAMEETSKAILFVNVDQPLSARIIDELIESHERTQAGIQIPVYGRRRGHPVLLSTRLMEALQSIKEATQGLKSVIREFHQDTVQVDIEDPSVLYNFNTPSDYQGGSST